MSKRIIIFILSIFIGLNAYSQNGCSITSFQTNGSNPLDCGDSLIIGFNAYASLALQDTFGPTSPSDTNWVSTGGAQYDEPYIPSPTNDDYFWMGPSATTPAALTTTTYDVSGGGQVCFDFVYAVQGGASPTEGPDQYDEGIALQYNTGAGWVDIVYYAPNGDTLPANPNVTTPNVSAGPGSFTAWTSVCLDLPPGALTTATSFQWVQENNSGNTGCCDHWGLDNIIIATASPLYEIYLANDGSNLGSAPAFLETYITGDSTFNFFYTDGSSDTCYTTYTGIMSPTDVGPDLLLDCNQNIVQLEATGVSVNDNFTWSPITYLSDPTILNPEASPIDTTDYIFTSSCGTDTVTVNVVSNYIFSADDDTTICVGDSAYLQAYGGAQTYAWTPNDGSISDTTIANPIFTPTATTTYTLTADSAGCIKTKDITVYVSNKSFFLNIASPINCSGFGSTIYVVGGGLGPLTYNLSNANFDATQGFGSFSNVPEGTYTMLVNDSMSACPVQAPVVIGGGDITANIDSIHTVNPGCSGPGGGVIEIYTDLGPSSSTLYSIDSGATTSSSNVFSGLAAGTYIAWVQNGSCPADTQTVSLIATGGGAMEVEIVDSTDLSCFGSGDGEIFASASLGVAPFTYSLDDITYQTDSFFLNLNDGPFTIFAIDSTGCKDSVTTNLSASAPSLLNNITVTDAICFGDSGSISFDVINGTAPYQYSVDNGVNYSNLNTFNDLPTGAYTLLGMDTNGCLSLDSNVTISQPTAVSLVEDSTQESNCGAPDGSIYVSSSGGTGSITYTLDSNPAPASGIFTGLTPGLYTIVATDINGCSSTITSTVNNFCNIILSITAFDSVSCNGLNDASVQLSVFGAVAPLSFNDGTGPMQADSLLTNLDAGIHNFVVTDVNGDQGTVSINIYEPAVLDVTAVQDSVSCFGASDGQIILTGSGGTMPYAYAVDNPMMPQVMPNFPNQSVGMHTGYIADANGCIDSVSQEVFQADSIILMSMVDSANCFGASDGLITITGTGGVPTYTYSFDGGTSFGAMNSSNEGSGMYNLMIEDGAGCQSASYQVTVFEPTDLVLDSVNMMQSNCNLSNGSLEVLASGGVGPYSYSLNSGTPQPTGVFNNITAMNHNIIVTDANGCTESIFLEVTEISGVTLSLVSNDSVSCGGASDATVVLSGSGGVMPYSYSLVGGPINQGSATFTSLSGGNNVFYFTDANANCYDTVTVNIFEPNAINLFSGTDSVSCHSLADGSIQLNAVGGGSSYLYAIDNPAATQSSPTFNGYGAGTYTGYVTDENGCGTSTTINLFEPDTLIITATNAVDVSCNADGRFTVDATGGTQPYSYSISGGPTNQTSNMFNLANGGGYTLSVLDNNGCSASALDTITEPVPVTFVVDSATGTLVCNGQYNGYISVTPSGGSAPYGYSIDNGLTFQSQNFFNGLAPGTYNILVQDMFNCPSPIIPVTIAQPNAIMGTTSSTDITCSGLTDGSVIINTITGGTAPYMVFVNGDSSVYVPNLTFSGLAAGTYPIEIRDGNGCTIPLSETINDVSAIVLGIQDPINASCFGVSDGIINISASGGTPNYTFNINQASFQDSVVNATSATFSGLAGSESGISYSIVVTDGNGCTASLIQTVQQPNQLVIDSISVSPVSCFGEQDGALLVSASGGSSPYTYTWTPSNQTGDMATGLTPGVYSVEVTDNNNCSISASQTILDVAPVLANIVPDSVFISMGDTVSLAVNLDNVIGSPQYSWSPTTGLSCTDCVNPVVTTYNDMIYSVVVTDDNGCSSFNFNEVKVIVDGSLFYFIPNAFTPNADGINDVFQVEGQDIQSVNMTVYNRWGEKVFDGANQNISWDGNYKGNASPGGVYTYVVQITFLNDVEIQETGSITLLR